MLPSLSQDAPHRQEALRKAYAEQLPTRIRRIEALLDEVVRERANPSSIRALENDLHSLAGSSRALEVEGAADAARSFELFLRAQVFDTRVDPRELQNRFAGHLQSLKDACLASSRGLSVEVESNGGEDLLSPERVSRVVYFLSTSGSIAQDLGFEFGCFGYAVRWFQDASKLLRALEQVAPVAVIVDAQPFQRGLDEVREIDELREREGIATALLVLSSRTDLDSRLAAVQAGGDDYYLRPLETRQVLERLDRPSHAGSEPYRVLIVPADYGSGLDYALTLQRAGMSVSMVESPEAVWAQLVDFKPEAILISLALKEMSGHHLGAVLRQQDAYVNVPMIFLSRDSSLEARLRAVRSDADDLMTEPVDPDYLVSALCHHVQRARALRRFVVTDSLTGLLTHSAFVERLEVEIERARSARYQLSYAVIDIDHLNSINETFGHLSGDSVLTNLARLLVRRLRRADLVGRWGGDELVVLMPETSGADALRVLDHVREMYAGISHRAGETEFSPTFSCGVSTLSEEGGAETLHQAARAMLKAARIQGSNRVVLAQP